MRLGLDIHGVLDDNPEEFIKIADDFKEMGGDVYIITGSSHDEDLDEYLLKLSGGRKFWDVLISVQDELAKKHEPAGINEHGRPYWPDEVWDRFKGDFCRENMINLHFDDTERYLQYFTTPVIHYYPHIKNKEDDGELLFGSYDKMISKDWKFIDESVTFEEYQHSYTGG